MFVYYIESIKKKCSVQCVKMVLCADLSVYSIIGMYNDCILLHIKMKSVTLLDLIETIQNQTGTTFVKYFYMDIQMDVVCTII